MKNRFFLVLISTIPLIFLLTIYSTIDPVIPIHLNAQFEVDSYGSKVTLLFLTIIPIITSLIFVIFIKFIKQNSKVYNILTYSIILFLDFIIFSLIAVLAYNKLYLINLIFIPLGLLLLIVGNYSPKLEQNKFIGIRTPATLKSVTVWNKTHIRGGYLFTLSGFILLLTSIFLFAYPLINLVLVIILITSDVIYLTIYAHQLYKNEQKK